MNNVILRGRLTTATEVRVTADQNPTTIARFSLAVPDKSHRNHESNYDTDFIRIVAFNKLAENLQQYTDKGSEIIVTGRLHTYTYKNQEDRNIYMSEVIAEKVEFISSCNRGEITIPDSIDDELPFA